MKKHLQPPGGQTETAPKSGTRVKANTDVHHSPSPDDVSRLQRELEQYRSLYDLAPAGYFTLTADGIIRLANLAGAKLVGVEPDRLPGHPFEQMVAKSDRPEFNRLIARVFATAAKQTGEVTLVSTEPAPVIVQIEAGPSPDGAECRILLSDITERRRTDQALRTTLSRVNELKQALDENSIVAITDPQGRITFVNDKFCAISRYSREELIGQDHRLINSGHHSTEFIRNLWSTITHGKVWKGEIKNKAKDGSFYWVDTTIVPFLNEQGKPRQYVAIRTDITERKRIEDELRASLKQVGDLETALDEHAIVAITDPQGRITYVNDKFCAISRYSREELIGQDHRIINSGHHPTEFIRALWTTIGSGKVWKGEIKNKAKDGSYYWVDTTIVPFLNEQGKPRQYVAIRADITERKRVEERLRASLNEVNDLKAALDEHAIVAITDPQGRITYVNDKFCAISKYSREELIGQDHRIINSGHHPTEFIRNLWSTITHGKVWKGEIKNKAKDGSFYWVDTTIVPFLGDKGKPRQYVAIRADITERKRAEEAFRESEELFSKAFRLSPDCVAIVRLSDRTVIRANEALCKLWGSTPEDIIGKPTREYTSWQSEEERIRFMGTLEDKGECLNYETTLRLADGRLVDFNISSRMITFNRESCVLSVMRDVTEARRAGTALRESEARLISTLSAGSIGTWTWDIANDRLIADEFTAKAFSVDVDAAAKGLPAAEYLGAVTEDDRPAVSSALDHAIQSCGRYDIEYRVRQKDGTVLWLQAKGRVEGDAAGKAVHFHGAVMDITERKQAEELIRKLNTDLERRVTERTAQLEAANRELEAFSYSVSHDLRAPLRAVDGFSQAVLEDFGPQLQEEGRRYLQTIRGSAQKMGTLIDDLLTFSRLSRATLKKQTVNTAQLVRAALDDLRHERKGQQIDLRIGELSPCMGDPALLKQVWINLLSNALKYTQKRDNAVVEIGCENKADGCVFFVRDNGTGFEMRYAGKLFGVFQRLHRAEDYEGTGVGLAIVQRVIHRHGGRVWAEAAVDKGATFYFTLNSETGT